MTSGKLLGALLLLSALFAVQTQQAEGFFDQIMRELARQRAMYIIQQYPDLMREIPMQQQQFGMGQQQLGNFGQNQNELGPNQPNQPVQQSFANSPIGNQMQPNQPQATGGGSSKPQASPLQPSTKSPSPSSPSSPPSPPK